MVTKPARSERYDLIVFEDFTYQGQKRSRAFRVGTAVASSKGGFVMYIPAGVSLTGRVLAVPEKTPMNEVDVLEAYQSAADAYGV
ncbi:hypothetical protein [Nitrobacter sp. TKz-YC01]|uniref:hypothetical protein n=1 Tax=Nitrobacter sp. TKz-YC01 TaxID=3398703 RepID=UPI003A0FECDD